MLEIRTPGSRPRNLLRASAQKLERRIGALIPRRRLRSAFQALGRGSVGGVGEVLPAIDGVDIHPQAHASGRDETVDLCGDRLPTACCYTCSNSISVPLKSLGWRNSTGLPCAP